jgi:hypothetical protein
MKVHLRRRSLAGRTYRLVTLRPSVDVWYSTNFFHQTWHILSDLRGGRLLARLLWGLAYQRAEGTLVLIHGNHIRPTPFDAAPSDPILLVPSDLTSFDADAFAELKDILPRLGPPDQTIRWQTFGLDTRLKQWEQDRWLDEDLEILRRHGAQRLWAREQMSRTAGFVCYTAPAVILRLQAARVHRLHVGAGPHAREMDYTYLAEHNGRGSWAVDGEVQLFADYRESISAAIQARREVLSRPDQPVDPEHRLGRIYRRSRAILASRRGARGRS